MDLGSVVYTVRTTVVPGAEDVFNRWQAEEHIPQLLTVPGYIGVRRYAELANPRSFMNVWEITSKSNFYSRERDIAVTTPWKAQIAPLREALTVDLFAPIATAGRSYADTLHYLVSHSVDIAKTSAIAGGVNFLLTALKEQGNDNVFIRAFRNLDNSDQILILEYRSSCPTEAPPCPSAPWIRRCVTTLFQAVGLDGKPEL